MTIDLITAVGASTPAFTSTSQDSLLAKPAAQTETDAASNDSPDPLMTALQQTLSQLAGGNSGDPVVRHVVADANISLESIPRSNNPSVGDVETTGAQLLAALYRALAMQENAAAASGASSQEAEDAGAINVSGVTGVAVATPSASGDVSAYTDLSSRIASLSDASRSVASQSTGHDTFQWDHFADTTPAQDTTDASDERDPMTTALSNLNDALQAHMEALGQDPGTGASLPDVLDTLSGNTVGLSWQPVGAVVDLMV
jgi:hypothetical protein